MDHHAANKPRRGSMILEEPEAKKPAVRCGEVVGGKTAECAAICCCCPCAVIDLVIFTVVKIPAGLCRKAMRKRRSRIRRRRMLKEAAAGGGKMNSGSEGPREDDGSQLSEEAMTPVAVAAEVREKESEMWARFYGAGFWRSPSQREANSN